MRCHWREEVDILHEEVFQPLILNEDPSSFLHDMFVQYAESQVYYFNSYYNYNFTVILQLHMCKQEG